MLTKHFIAQWLIRGVCLILIVGMLNLSIGCAAIFRGTSQTVTIRTIPEGKTVMFQGVRIKDGGTIHVSKRFDAPEFNVGAEGRPYFVEMHYSPDPWLIADCVGLIFYIVPGLIALGVDFGTGAWRHLENPQIVYVPDYD